ncbi:lung adenoma susceptibility protein 2 isoform X2 [Engraulis encrasicolus]|uniref:lung adenoma susceptibility protein 2 isoform X2 n=1 Tax=Engraulis encrasicolus TaxID=184585 RepID=UPI002FCE8988
MSGNGILSPESTVTSLLARSGHTRSTHDTSQTIWFKDRNYESASEALDAYIADFQMSQLKSGQSSGGELKLPKTPAVTSRLTCCRKRNKDVLKESLSDKELNFLHLPVGTQRRNPDRLSLSTDDLLVLPCDGSLPITRTSALLSQSDTQLPGHSLRPQPHVRTQRSRRTTATPVHKSHHIIIPSKLECSSVGQSYSHWSSSARTKLSSTMRTPLKKPAELKQRTERAKTTERTKAILPESTQQVDSQLVKTSAADLNTPHVTSKVSSGQGSPGNHHYPRWMTSQKSEMDFSGVTSVPDLKYPAWLQECDPSTEPADATRPGHPVPSWVGELDESSQVTSDDGRKMKDLTGHQRVMAGFSEAAHSDQTEVLLQGLDGQGTLRELRLQFAEQLALEVENQKDADSSQPFRDDKIESLILKAEQALHSPSLGISSQLQPQPQLLPQQKSSPGGTEEVLEEDRSWDNPPVTFKSPVPVGVSCTPQKPEECGGDAKETFYSSSSGYSSRKHPGPVEALKQMLFSLQAVEQRVSLDQPAGGDTGADCEGQIPPPLPLPLPLSQKHQAPTEEVPNLEVDYISVPGGESLQRALHHLGRLKNLVDDIKEKKERAQQTGRHLHVT